MNLNSIDIGTFCAGAIPIAMICGFCTPLIAFTCWTVIVPLLFVLFSMSSPVVLFFAVALDLVNAGASLLFLALFQSSPETRIDWSFLFWHTLFYLLVALPGLVGGIAMSPFVQTHISHTKIAHHGFGFIDLAVAVIFAYRAYVSYRSFAAPTPHVQRQSSGDYLRSTKLSDHTQHDISQPYLSISPQLPSEPSMIPHESTPISHDAHPNPLSAGINSDHHFDASTDSFHSIRFDTSSSSSFNSSTTIPFSSFSSSSSSSLPFSPFYHKSEDSSRVIPSLYASRDAWVRFWACVICTFIFGVISGILGIGGGLLYVLIFLFAEQLEPFNATMAGNGMMFCSCLILVIADFLYMYYFALFDYSDYWVRLLITLLSGIIGSFFGAILTRRIISRSPFIINPVSYTHLTLPTN